MATASVTASLDASHRSSLGFEGMASLANKQPPVDVLLEAAEIETRLRAHMLELIEPTIQKQRQQDGKIKDLRQLLDGMSGELTDIQRSLEGQETFRGQVETFRAELADKERQRREHE